MTRTNPFIGTWKLVSWEVVLPDGTIRHPFGENVVGYLIYTGDGYMAAAIMDPDRRQSDPKYLLETVAENLPEADRAKAFGTYLSYCGTYTVEGNTLTHHVKAGSIPGWTGSEQLRPYRFEGGRLIIEPGSGNILTWKRARKRACIP